MKFFRVLVNVVDDTREPFFVDAVVLRKPLTDPARSLGGVFNGVNEAIITWGHDAP